MNVCVDGLTRVAIICVCVAASVGSFSFRDGSITLNVGKGVEVIDTLQAEIEALGTGSQSATDVDTCISVCAQSITNPVSECVAFAG